MKNLLLITIIALTVACSKDESSGLKMNSDGMYTITNRSELEEFNSILEGDTTVLCVLAYAEKKTISKSDVPGYVGSVYGVDLPECIEVKICAFEDCESLVSVDLPKCTTLEYGVFLRCYSLVNANLSECVDVAPEAFMYCTSLTTIDLPKCTDIGDKAFMFCSSLVSISLPECLTIGEDAFASSSLTMINLPECTSVGGWAFLKCDLLTDISLPRCKSIGILAFQSCYLLTKLSLLSTESITIKFGIGQVSQGGTFAGFSSEKTTLILNARGKEKENIANNDTWKDEVWKEIILK